jgi:hypothetical protein
MKQLIFLTALVFLMASCEKPPDVSTSLTSTSDMQCKSGSDLKTGEPGKTQSCISYEYDGDSTLYLVHYNAGFNCCPEQILVDFEVKGDSLIITEDDLKQDCRCNCLFHVNITIHNLKKTKYHVKIIEPLARVESLLVFDLDLKKKATGQECVTRDYIPWQ